MEQNTGQSNGGKNSKLGVVGMRMLVGRVITRENIKLEIQIL